MGLNFSRSVKFGAERFNFTDSGIGKSSYCRFGGLPTPASSECKRPQGAVSTRQSA